MEEADIVVAEKKEELDKILEPITNPKKQESTFQKRLFEYNKPLANIIIAAIFAALQGVIGPLTGWFIIKCIFAMIYFNPQADEMNTLLESMDIEPFFYNQEKLKVEMRTWILAMIALSFGALIFQWIAKFLFGIVSDNITLNVRQNLYQSILKKHMGWHDNAENATGVLTGVLAQDVMLLNGVSTEVMVAQIEATSSMVGGIVIAFIFTWKVALVACGVAPFMMIGAVIGSNLEQA